uniref:Uncharacterized mitochondrial protein AtMg00810-like n=1 Tax=Tanacetum cinerariifolium TaxID=118510 RepID=A0A6L2MKS9_TANCI|nr:uncharacterized mitochondrial protein AtMg00810-like [Tanacetum cinerariifolium]
MKLNELMELCTSLQSRVIDLENTKTTQALEITSLKRRVKKVEKKQRSRAHKLKRLYKVSAASEVSVASIATTVSAAATITTDEITLAQALVEIKTSKPKAKGVELVECTSKRAGEELTQESSKKQKVDDDKETTELKKLMEIIPNIKEVVINVIPLAINFGVDDVKDFKEYTLRDYYCWLKTYYCWYKLKLLDDAAGLQVKKKEDGIFISQDKYVAKILRKFSLTDGQSASTPIDTKKPLLKDPDGEDVDTIVATSSTEAEYVATASCCAQKTNDVVRLQALIDRRKVIITKDTVRQALHLDDADSINCLPNKEIFKELARMRSLALTQKVFANIRRFGKGFSGMHTSLFEGMLVPHQVHDDIDAAAEDKDVAEPSPPSRTPATTPPPPQQEFIYSPQVAPTPPPSPHQSPIAQPSSPPQQQPSQPSHTTNIFMDLFNTLLETCTTLTKNVKNLEKDKIAQVLEITHLKQRVRRLEKKRKLKAFGLKRLKKVGIAQRVESSTDTVMDDQEDVSKQGEIAKIDADEDVTLEEVNADKDAEVQGRLEEFQAYVYHLDLEYAQKVLSMQDDEAEHAELKEASAPRRRRGVIIHDLEETATPLAIMHSEPMSKDKGKVILVEEPKPLKKQAHIEQDEAYARELKGQLNANINWNEVIEQHFNSIMAFLEKGEEDLEEEASKQSKKKSKTSKEKAAKKQKLNEEVKELKTHLQIVLNDEDDVYTEATPLALKVLVIDYQIHTDHNKPYYKIIRADGTHQVFLSFISLLRNFDREDLEMLWKIIQERFASSEPKNFSDDFLLNALKTMFEKPNVEANI